MTKKIPYQDTHKESGTTTPLRQTLETRSYMAFGPRWCSWKYHSCSCFSFWLCLQILWSCGSIVCDCSGISCCHFQFPSCSWHSLETFLEGSCCHEQEGQNCKKKFIFSYSFFIHANQKQTVTTFKLCHIFKNNYPSMMTMSTLFCLNVINYPTPSLHYKQQT